MKDKLSPKLVAAIAVGLAAVVALVGWFGVISPQRSKATTLDQQIVEEQSRLSTAELLVRSQKATKKGKTSGTALLATAMPSALRMPAVLKEVQRLAKTSDVSLESFSPSTGMALSGYAAVPIDVSVLGRYKKVQRFLNRLRVQAASSGDKIKASGRLYDVQTIGLAPSSEETPDLTANIRLVVFVYTGTPLAAEGEASGTDDATDSAVADEGVTP